MKDSFTEFCAACTDNIEHLLERNVLQQPAFCVITIKRFKQLRTGRVHKNSTVKCNEDIPTPRYEAEIIALVFNHSAITYSGYYTSVVKINFITKLNIICMSNDVSWNFSTVM